MTSDVFELETIARNSPERSMQEFHHSSATSIYEADVNAVHSL